MSLQVSLFGVIYSPTSSSTLNRLLNRLVGVCGGINTFDVDLKDVWLPNYMQHVIVYVPGTFVGCWKI